MRTRHPPGCVCDQPLHHQQSTARAHTARRSERERMNAAREIGKILSNVARERRASHDDDL